jgi:hypothetical protein
MDTELRPLNSEMNPDSDDQHVEDQNFDDQHVEDQNFDDPNAKIFGCFFSLLNALKIKLCGAPYVNQVQLMLEILPTWANFMSKMPAYGHFTFVNNSSRNLAVYLSIDTKPYNYKNEERLKNEIKQLFNNFDCTVINFRIIYLAQNLHIYHLEHLSKPLNNQLYQLFLLGLESPVNWQIYKDRVEKWEIDQYIERYLQANLSSMLYHLGMDSLSDERLHKLLQEWTYLLIPFQQLDFKLPALRYYADAAMKKHRIHPNYHAIGLLINLVYETDNYNAETGYWRRIFFD